MQEVRVIVAGNPKVELAQGEEGRVFGLKGLDETTRQGLERALQLEREGVRVRVLMILDHPKEVRIQQLLDPTLKAGEKQKRSQSPHCDDLHPDITAQLISFLAEANFPRDRLGILLEGVVFERRKKIFPDQRGCEVAAATALRLASGYIFDPVERKIEPTYIASPVEVFLSPDGGMDEGHLAAAREYFKSMGFKPGLIIKGRFNL